MPSDPDPPPKDKPEIEFKRLTVMVVEDEDVIRDVICAFLKKIGVRRIIAVGNAEDAIYRLEQDDDLMVSVVLVDLMLPGASGLALIKTLREHDNDRLTRLPIVVITSYTSMKVYRKASEFDINRLFLEAVLWRVRAGSPWRDLPPAFGNWNSVFQRFRRWAKKGVFERLFEELSAEPDFEYALIDATIVSVHQKASGAKGGLKIRPSADHGAD